LTAFWGRPRNRPASLNLQSEFGAEQKAQFDRAYWSSTFR
jgi:hypothetical protein